MTAIDEIMELIEKRKPAHLDPNVDRQILRIEIEDVLHKISQQDEIDRLTRVVEDYGDLEDRIRCLETTLDDSGVDYD